MAMQIQNIIKGLERLEVVVRSLAERIKVLEGKKAVLIKKGNKRFS